MNFDYGNILTRTFQIIWKHKTLWIILTLPMLLSFAMLPFGLAPAYFLYAEPQNSPDLVFVIAMLAIAVLFFVVSSVGYVVVTSAFSVGMVRLERGKDLPHFAELIKSGFEYFWRQLGVFLIVQLSMGLIFTLAFAFLFFATVVTMGIASFCLQPIFIIITPLSFLVLAILENAHLAVVYKNLSALDALKHSLAIVRDHFWRYFILIVIIYFIVMILSSILTFPLILPAFFMPFLFETNPDLSTAVQLILGGFMCIFILAMSVLSGLSQAFIKTSLSLAYFRLSTPTDEQVISLPENP